MVEFSAAVKDDSEVGTCPDAMVVEFICVIVEAAMVCWLCWSKVVGEAATIECDIAAFWISGISPALQTERQLLSDQKSISICVRRSELDDTCAVAVGFAERRAEPSGGSE